MGEVVTEEVTVEVQKETTRGGCPTGESNLTPCSEPLWVLESQPVTVNDAQFVVVAQRDWKPGSDGEAVPIAVQLRVTNLSKKDLLFPTFDALRLRLALPDGSRIAPRGGRDITIFTRPYWLPAGASCAIGAELACDGYRRHAELLWDENIKALHLTYFDGTGTWMKYGSLAAGKYHLTFSYQVGSQGPFDTRRDDGTWIGKVQTEGIPIDVFGR